MEVRVIQHESHQDGSGQLKRILGVSFGIAVTIGGMIGLGILRTPGNVAAQIHEPWLILTLWAVGGIYALFGVFATAELGVAIPQTGGWYAYSRRAFGEYPGFATGWMDWIAYPATCAMIAIAIAEYLAELFEPLKGNIAAVAILTLLAITLVNWLGLRSGSRFQELLSFVKAGAFVVIVIAAFAFGDRPVSAGQGLENNLSTLRSFGAVIVALQAVIFTYDGWYSAIYFSEECKEPEKSIPRSMVASVVLVGAIYLSVNAALLYVLPVSELGSSPLPIADVAGKIFGVYGDKLVVLLALVTLFSLLNSNLLTAPRILFAISRDGLFLNTFAKVNKGGTPSNALFLTIAISIPIILTGTFETLLAVTAFLFIVLYVSGFLAVFVLRMKEPDLHRPYKALGFPWTTAVVLLGSSTFLIGALVTDTLNSLYAVGLIILSYPFYLLARRSRKSNEAS